MAATATAFPGDAAAAEATEISALKLQGCPDYEVHHAGSSSPAARAAALENRFELLPDRPATLVPPVDWRQDPYGNRTWVFHLHSFAWIAALLDGYAYAGDRTALVKARDLALDWIAQVGPSDESYGPLAWEAKSAGDRAGRFAYLARAAACEDLLTDAQASKFIDSLREHGTFLADPTHHPANNHGLFGDYGLALIAFQLPFLPEASSWETLAHARFADLLEREVAPVSGFYLEHSPQYQRLVATLAGAVSRLRPGSDLGSVAARMRAAAGWFVMPGDILVPLGDSSPQKVSLGHWLAESADAASGMLAAFDAGLGVVKLQRSYLAVTAWHHPTAHHHGDDLGFHLRDGARDIISDSGYHSYERSGFGPFARSSKAHSVLSVDGRDLPAGWGLAYGSGLRAAGRGAGWFAFAGVNPDLRQRGVHHQRLFVFKPRFGLLIIDRLRARRRHLYERRFQIAPGIDARRAKRGWDLAAPGFRGFLDAGPGRPRAFRGERDPIQGWAFPRFLEATPRWTLLTRSRARNVNLVASVGLRGRLRARIARASAKTVVLSVRAGQSRPFRLRVARGGRELRVSRHRLPRGRG